MMKHEEMITLIGNMFINAYVAGDRKDIDSFRSARADRDHLFDEIRELYAELEHESYECEQIQVELKKAQHEADVQRHSIQLKNDEILRLKEQLYCQADAECEEVPDHHDAFDAMFPGCTPDDLPFPDVAVAGLGPATTEASAYAEGEAAPASEVEGSDEL